MGAEGPSCPANSVEAQRRTRKVDANEFRLATTTPPVSGGSRSRSAIAEVSSVTVRRGRRKSGLRWEATRGSASPLSQTKLRLSGRLEWA
jgi:hypothetical protein